MLDRRQQKTRSVALQARERMQLQLRVARQQMRHNFVPPMPLHYFTVIATIVVARSFTLSAKSRRQLFAITPRPVLPCT